MIEFSDDAKYANVCRMVLEKGLDILKIPTNDVLLEVEFLDKDSMRELNGNTRNIFEVTDVLSFPSVSVNLPFSKSDYSPADIYMPTGAVILGQIAICTERAIEQATEFGHSVQREICFLAVHGLLHILGFDHDADSDESEMMQMQEKILNEAGIKRNMIDNTKEIESSLTKIDDITKIAPEPQFLSGTVAVRGLPNVGKSTLVNALVGEKVSIVSRKPQTTRNAIMGIMNMPNAQVLFYDTPGEVKRVERNALGKFMEQSIFSAETCADIIVYVIDAEQGIRKEDRLRIEKDAKKASNKFIIVVNKVDRINREQLVTLLTELNDLDEHAVAVVPLSALKSKNLDALKAEIERLLHPGSKDYDDSEYTDRTMRFMVAEIIREKTLRLLEKEVPFGIGVIIDKYQTQNSGVLEIAATIICAKASHKPIILGKSGAMIKKIGTYAREDIEEITGTKVYITLWVKVREEWHDNMDILRELGYVADVE
ncbi:MAG: GTPase Era [Christensenellaceae bacterium]|jgi:GTP-binding protein Era|nr:GTPase Era [Christensenellaceae bacterium]